MEVAGVPVGTWTFSPLPLLERICTGRNWIPNDRKRIRNGRIAAAVAQTRDILLNNLTTIVRGTCEYATWTFCDFALFIVVNNWKIVGEWRQRRNQQRDENYYTIVSLKWTISESLWKQDLTLHLVSNNWVFNSTRDRWYFLYFEKFLGGHLG